MGKGGLQREEEDRKAESAAFPPKGENRCNPGRIAGKREQSCSGLEGGIREAFRGER